MRHLIASNFELIFFLSNLFIPILISMLIEEMLSFFITLITSIIESSLNAQDFLLLITVISFAIITGLFIFFISPVILKIMTYVIFQHF
jgi:hypothetical protein